MENVCGLKKPVFLLILAMNPIHQVRLCTPTQFNIIWSLDYITWQFRMPISFLMAVIDLTSYICILLARTKANLIYIMIFKGITNSNYGIKWNSNPKFVEYDKPINIVFPFIAAPCTTKLSTWRAWAGPQLYPPLHTPLLKIMTVNVVFPIIATTCKTKLSTWRVWAD